MVLRAYQILYLPGHIAVVATQAGLLNKLVFGINVGHWGMK
jgi:hypothetical protein